MRLKKIMMSNREIEDALSFGALIWFVWVVAYPKPYILVLLVAFLFYPTMLFFVWRGPYAFSLLDTVKRPPGDFRISLTTPLAIVSFVLGGSALLGFAMVDYVALAVWAVPTSLLVGFILWYSIPKANLILALLFGAFYGLALVTYVNAAADGRPPVSISTQIVSMGSQTRPLRHFMTVVIEDRRYELPVTIKRHRSLKAGAEVCVIERYGLLGLRWIEPARCPDRP